MYLDYVEANPAILHKVCDKRPKGSFRVFLLNRKRNFFLIPVGLSYYAVYYPILPTIFFHLSTNLSASFKF